MNAENTTHRSNRTTVLAAAALAVGAVATLADASYTGVPMSWTTINGASLNTSFGPGGGAGGGVPNFFMGVNPSTASEYAYGYGHGAGGFDNYEFGFNPSTFLTTDSGSALVNFTLSTPVSIVLNARTSGITNVQLNGVTLVNGAVGGTLAAGTHSLAVFYNNSNPSDPLDTFRFGYSAIPAPGALALLGAAGLLGAGRRRR